MLVCSSDIMYRVGGRLMERNFVGEMLAGDPNLQQPIEMLGSKLETEFGPVSCPHCFRSRQREPRG